MIDTLVFDCFGTLINIEPDAYFLNHRTQAFNLLRAQKNDLPYSSFSSVWKTTFSAMEAASRITQNEFSMPEFVAEVQKKLGTNINNEQLVETYFKEWVLGLQPIAGVAESLNRIKKTKKIALISNTHYRELVTQALAIASIDPAIFDQIATSVETGKQKPHPAMMQTVIRNLGVTPDRTVMVGDSYHDDFGIAKAAGTRCLLIGGRVDPENSFEPGQYIAINSILDVEKSLHI